MVVPYLTSMWSPLVIHKNCNHSHAKHWTMFVCLLTYSHLKCKFWVYQNSEALGALTVWWCISIKRKTNQIRCRDCRAPLLACLCVTLSLWESIVEKFCHIDKNWDWTILFEEESDTAFFSKVWHHPYFQYIMVWVPVIAYSMIRKDFVTRYCSEHIYLWAVSGMLCCCMRIFQASSLNTTCDKWLLLTEVISVQNIGRWTPPCDLN